MPGPENKFRDQSARERLDPRRLITLIIITAVFISCAASPPLKEYPVRAIERPYTLPKDLASWKLIGLSWSVADPAYENRLRIFPLVWEQGVSQDVTIVWSPFPVDFRFQLARSKKAVYGVDLSLLGTLYTQGDDFIWRPRIVFEGRNLFTSKVAISWQGFVQPEAHPKAKDEKWSWSVGANAGPSLQAIDQVLITPKLHLIVEKSNPRALYPIAAPVDANSDWSVRYPLNVEALWAISKRVELELNYFFFRFGYPTGFDSHLVNLTGIYYF